MILLLCMFLGPGLLEKLKNDFTEIIMDPTEYKPNQIKDMSDKIRKYYFGDKPVDEESIEKIADVSLE